MYTLEEMDLYSDWEKIAKSELEQEGYLTNNIGNDEMAILYFSMQKKVITPVPRNILKSNMFSCPPEMSEGLELLEQKIRNGENLRPYQSRQLKNLESRDGLLFDWDIHHLHLGTVLETDGFIQRTGPLLYAKFDNQNVYFINVYEHGAWEMQNLLKILHRDFPESISKYKLNGIVGVEQNFSDDDIKHLRKASVNTAIELVPGEVYIGPGGGFVASGHSGDAVMKKLNNYHELEELQDKLKRDVEGIIRMQYENLDFITNSTLAFNLHKRNQQFYLKEKNNNFKIRLNN